jgi:hypothetical protein
MSNTTELLRRVLEAWDLKAKAGEAAKTFEDIRAFLAAEPEAEPVAWPVDREWLRTVLRFAEKNPDYFYDVEPGFISLDSGDTDTIITALNKSAEPAIRKPMTHEEIVALFESENPDTYFADFRDSIRLAENHHKIGDKK